MPLISPLMPVPTLMPVPITVLHECIKINQQCRSTEGKLLIEITNGKLIQSITAGIKCGYGWYTYVVVS